MIFRVLAGATLQLGVLPNTQFCQLFQIPHETRKHSSRMRTARFSSSWVGFAHQLPMQTPSPWMQIPLPLDTDPPRGRSPSPRGRSPWMQTPLPGRPSPGCRTPPPTVNRQTGVKTLTCPKLRLRAVINNILVGSGGSPGSVNVSSGGSKGGGARDAPPPPQGPKFFQFHAVFGKIWQNRMLAPPRGIGAPSSGKSWIRHW